MNIIMVGFGVVGQNVAETLASRSLELRKEYGVDPKVIAIVGRRGFQHINSFMYLWEFFRMLLCIQRRRSS